MITQFHRNCVAAVVLSLIYCGTSDAVISLDFDISPTVVDFQFDTGSAGYNTVENGGTVGADKLGADIAWFTNPGQIIDWEFNDLQPNTSYNVRYSDRGYFLPRALDGGDALPGDLVARVCQAAPQVVGVGG